MIKVFYMHPKADVEYFRNHHVSLARKLPGAVHLTMNVAGPAPDGTPPPFQLVNEMWFETEEDLQRMLNSRELQEAWADVPNFNPEPSSVVVVYTREEPSW